MKFGLAYTPILVSGVMSSPSTLQSVKHKSLREAYGDVVVPTEMFPYHRRPRARSGQSRFSAEYLASRTPEDCDFPLEIVLVQDLTASFEDDLTNMRSTQLQMMLDTLSVTHPGSAFATISFKDKPLWPLGDVHDYCVALASPLSTDPSVIKADYDKWAVYGGGDPPEAQFHALVAVSQSNTLGWGRVPTAARLVVVVTDAAPHFADDGMNYFDLPAFSGTFDEANSDDQCVQEYYPSPEQVREAIVTREAYLAALVYDGSFDYDLPLESWKWFNGFLNQTEGFVHNMEDDSSNFWERLSDIITHLEDVECGEVTTTESPVVTPAAATTPSPESPAETPCPTVPQPECPPVCPPPPQPECPPVCPPTGCDHCCCDGVVIKLRYNPQKLHLEVEK